MNYYFKFPIFFDLLIASFIALILKYCIAFDLLNFPDETQNLSLTSDLANISLTSAGFVLTLLTVLITFKSSSKITKESKISDQSVFELFFATKLYGQTVHILKYCVISLLVISLFGYVLKLMIPGQETKVFFYFNSCSIVILFLTLCRCLFILNRIIRFQTEDR